MAAGAQGLKFAENEAVRLVMMWDAVIGDGRWRHHATREAHRTQRMVLELQLRASTPIPSAVKAPDWSRGR
jgi:hypothetical protein